MQRCKLTSEEVALYAAEKYTWMQMHQIRVGLTDGLTVEQVKLYADEKYNFKQMFEIREGLENGLTSEQISLYANEKYDWSQMEQIRERLENELMSKREEISDDAEDVLEESRTVERNEKNNCERNR